MYVRSDQGLSASLFMNLNQELKLCATAYRAASMGWRHIRCSRGA